ncbi:unnamed protein product [Rotaria magnacalcarata]|uniref:Uncharacterized protein n=1 Tax=Rotaria magnacalcarata TaxID=392030 RepID=A0A8S2V3Q3_9BILA|nr:unnamed protein product [Rotaria magnacalcarata]
MRTLRRFAQDSLTASRLQRKEKGHVGVSVMASIMDTQLPRSIIIDYPHSSLLRHAKAMFKELYKSLRPSDPTEIRNILFYDFVPVFHRLLPPDILSHFALFICGLRLLHGRATFGNENSKIADELITRYYKDFSNYYNGLENLVLHFHMHFTDQCKQFGSLSHLGSFGQESLIVGYVSSNRQGTRLIGDTICRNYSIDFIIHNNLTVNPHHLPLKKPTNHSINI